MRKKRSKAIFVLGVLLVLGVTVKLTIGGYMTCPPRTHGCTPGFWKNHPEEWPIGPNTLLSQVFDVPAELQGHSLMMALNYPGGRGYLGAARILLRTATAALNNILHPDVHYRGGSFGFSNWGALRDAVNEALSSGDRNFMLGLAEQLDTYNNWDCPLGDDE